MVKSIKTHRLREKMEASVKQSEQSKLDTITDVPKKESPQSIGLENKKRILITEIETAKKEDELALKIGFKLLPSRAAFSRIATELYFDGQKMYVTSLRIPQTRLATIDFDLPVSLDMRGISAGSHRVKVEMYELWGSVEKLTSSSKEITVDYVPIRRQDRLVRIPTIKSVAGADLSVLSDSERDIYREIDEDMKKELASKRDEW